MMSAGAIAANLLGVGSGMTATATPSSVTGNYAGSNPVATPNATVSVSGGSGSYTYSWVRTSGDPITTAANPTSSFSGFQRTAPSSGTWVSTWQCQVTDTVTSEVVNSNTVTATINR